MTQTLPPAWYVAVLDAERLVLSDDSSGAVLARRRADVLLARMGEQAMAQACPDPKVFELFQAALTLWASRLEPHERDRVRGIALSAIASVCALAREAERLAQARARLSPLERAVAAGDR